MIMLLVFTIALLIIGSIAIGNEWGLIALAATTVYTSILYGMGLIDLVWIKDNPFIILGVVAGYLAVGVGWMFYKWVWYLKRVKAKYLQAHVDYTNQPSGKWSSFEDYWRSYANYRDGTIPPSASENKERLVRYLTYWPFDMLDYIFSYLLRDFMNAIYNYFSGTLQRISDSIFKGV